MKVVIADDEPLAREILTHYVKDLADVELVGVCKNASEVFTLMGKHKIDLLLLDINMPEMSGIDYLRTVKEPPLVIFTTAYAEYAVESYELNAVDYLLKPIAFRRFQTALERAAKLLDSSSTSPAMGGETAEEKSLFVRSDGKWIQIDLSELWMVEGLKDYLRLNVGEQRITIHSTMKNFEDQLSGHRHFIRVHKSYIINLKFAKAISGAEVVVGSQPIAIGATYRDAIRSRMEELKMIFTKG